MLKQALTAEAFERLGRVKMANPELYAQAVRYVLQLYQSTGRKVDEQSLIKLLNRLRPKKKDTRIRILRK